MGTRKVSPLDKGLTSLSRKKFVLVGTAPAPHARLWGVPAEVGASPCYLGEANICKQFFIFIFKIRIYNICKRFPSRKGAIWRPDPKKAARGRWKEGTGSRGGSTQGLKSGSPSSPRVFFDSLWVLKQPTETSCRGSATGSRGPSGATGAGEELSGGVGGMA